MEKTGIILIKGNSITFTLAEIQKNGYFKIINELSYPLKLYENLLVSYEFSDSMIEETVSILRNFKSLATTQEAKMLITVSTSFLLKANNKDIFIKTINEELDLELTILTNRDEIYYNYLAAINSIYLDNVMLVNICEDSTHVIWILDKAIKDSFTLPIGSTNLTYHYNLQDKVLKEDFDKAIINIRKEFKKLHKIKGIKFNSAIGVGEIFHSIARLDIVRKKYPLEVIHNYTTNDIDIYDVCNLLKCKNLMQRKRLHGLPNNMADIIVGGSLILQELVSYFDITNITISERGLKEGIIFNYIEEKYIPTPDILDQSLNGIIENLNINKSHSEHVYFITRKLFDYLKPLHHLGDNYNNIIKTASYLHDIGLKINYCNHHINSFYMILNSYINGLTHKELLISSAIAASHGNNSYNLSLSKYCLIINKLNIKAIDEIGILLTIAEALDISLKSIVEDLQVTIKENSVIIKVYSKSDLKFEIQQVLKSSRRFHEIYDRNLFIYKDKTSYLS